MKKKSGKKKQHKTNKPEEIHIIDLKMFVYRLKIRSYDQIIDLHFHIKPKKKSDLYNKSVTC